MPKIYSPTLHPRIEQRKRQGPVKVRDVMKKDSPIARFNTWLAVKVTIGVGQNVLAAASDKRSEATYEDADAVLHTALQIQDHLLAQDLELEKLVASLPPAKAQ